MRTTTRGALIVGATTCLIALVAPLARAEMNGTTSSPPLAATPAAQCGPGSRPETGIQGRVSAQDVADGRATEGYLCNTALVGHYGTTGGFRVYRYVDQAGHVCAFYDTTLMFPTNALLGSTHKTGVFVLDMSNPAQPVQTADLVTPAMQSPHESLSLNVPRGLLAADMGMALAYPGFVDVYSVRQDCRHPVLQSSLPVGVLGHEGTFSPDGNTFWSSSAGGGTLAAIDVSHPASPRLLWVGRGMDVHGLRVSDDGNTLYFADLGNDGRTPGLTILDVSQIQHRTPNPLARIISHITWPSVSIPQVPLPVTIHNHPYLVEMDEYATKDGAPLPSSDPTALVGAGRIIDIANPSAPKVVSNIRLAVNTPAGRAASIGDPGASNPLQGYAGHYCAVPQEVDPGIVACSFILSGLRVFDIRDPLHPKEIAYFNMPPKGGASWNMSAPAFDVRHQQIWYADGFTGFWAVQLTNGVWPTG